jgi:hypothetical protein
VDEPFPLSAPGTEAVGCSVVAELCAKCLRKMSASYSFDKRRRASSATTRAMTPMQVPANMPLEVTCHDFDMKPT